MVRSTIGKKFCSYLKFSYYVKLPSKLMSHNIPDAFHDFQSHYGEIFFFSFSSRTTGIAGFHLSCDQT